MKINTITIKELSQMDRGDMHRSMRRRKELWLNINNLTRTVNKQGNWNREEIQRLKFRWWGIALHDCVRVVKFRFWRLLRCARYSQHSCQRVPWLKMSLWCIVGGIIVPVETIAYLTIIFNIISLVLQYIVYLSCSQRSAWSRSASWWSPSLGGSSNKGNKEVKCKPLA